ncbi:MAG TPA: urease accessory protein UreF [Drouetiella sp.]
MTRTNVAQMLSLMQMSDSALPIGGYSNSWGFETWVQNETLTRAADVERAIETLLTSSIAPNDGVACSLAHRFAVNKDLKALLRLNEYLTAGRWCPEPLAASLNMGERLKQLALNTGWAESLPDLKMHHSVVFGWLSGEIGIHAEDAVAAYLYSSVAGLVSASVRLVPLGHTDGQRILTVMRTVIARLVPDCLCKDLEDLGGFAPLSEWAAKEHETLYSRLFQS